MPDNLLAGQDTPVVNDEVQNLTPAQTNVGTTEAQTDGADGGKESPVPRTYTEEELRERIERATAKAAAKAERRAFREATQRLNTVQPKEPERANFTDEASYTQAQLDYLAEKKAEEKLKQREEAQKAERMQEALHERIEKASERYADFQAVTSNPNLPITEAVLEFCADSEEGGEILYFLGKNPLRAADIARMTPIKAARELAKLESELASKPKAKPSKAPEPISPVGKRSASPSSSPSDEDDVDTWMRKERERMKNRGR